MKYGFVMAYGDARDAAELAPIAEAHGWDGFFVWESIWGIDAWVMLGAAAMTTERIRLGTMLTPLPRRKPWDVAGQVSTVDNLSGGRVILSVGLGVTGEDRFWLFEEDPGRKVRAELMDESLELLPHLWRDQPFEYSGKHYQSRKIAELMPPAPPPPVQQPRVPTWVVGGWPRPKSMRRAALQDGWLPAFVGDGEVTPEVVAEGVDWIRKEREDARPDDGRVRRGRRRHDPRRRHEGSGHGPPVGRGRCDLVDRRRLVVDGPGRGPPGRRTSPESRPAPRRLTCTYAG